MITNNLKNLLEKSNTSIKELSETTGINRNSLTNLANGTSQMVRFDTLNKLIKYLLSLGFSVSSPLQSFA